MIPHYFHRYAIILFIFIIASSLVGCELTFGNQYSNDQASQVIIQGENPNREEILTIELNNCDGKADTTRTEERSKTIDVTISAEIAQKLGASAEIISAEVQTAVGLANKQGAQRSTSIQLVAPPGTRMVFQLVWFGNEQIGIVQNLRGINIPIAFRIFSPTDVRIKSQTDIGCPGSIIPQQIITAQPIGIKPIDTPASAQQNALCPTSISQGQFEPWRYGAENAPILNVQNTINEFDLFRKGSGAYITGATIPGGMLIATNFDEIDANKWNQLSVIPIIHSGSWGIWQTTGEFIAPNDGACLTIVP